MIRSILFALLSALFLTLSFPRFDFAFLAWLALIPMLIAIKDQSLKAGFGLAFLTGILFFMGIFYWINVIHGLTSLDFLLLGIYLGAYIGLFGLAFTFISQTTSLPPLLTAPVLWVSLEYLRSHFFFLALPWALLGHSQYRVLPVIQIADLTGVYGVSFVIVMVNMFVAEAIQKRHIALRPALATLGILALSLGYGVHALASPHGKDHLRVTVIQGNIPQDVKWQPALRKRHLQKHVSLTQSAVAEMPTSLIVWPETSVQGYLRKDAFSRRLLMGLARDTHTYLLVGSSQRPKTGPPERRATHRLNSAFLIAPDRGLVGRYDKIRLFPFGEYLPYANILPWPQHIAASVNNFLPGQAYTTLHINGHAFGVLICWENLFPGLVRQFVKQGAAFLVNITNEAWFGKTAAPYQFVPMSVFRAVENRVPLARSANTGISGFINAQGRILGTVQQQGQEIFVEGHLTKDLQLGQRLTFYTRYGDVFIYLNVAMLIAVVGWAIASAICQRRSRGVSHG